MTQNSAPRQGPTGSLESDKGIVTLGAGVTNLAALSAVGLGSVVPAGALKVTSLTASNGEIVLGSTSSQPLVVDYTGASPNSTIQGYVAAGRGSINVNGIYQYDNTNGITNDAIASVNGGVGFNQFAIAAIDNADVALYDALGTPDLLGGPNYGTFGTITGIDSTSVLVRYTYAGDCNLDGLIDAKDFALINLGFNNPSVAAKGWIGGDFNNDGIVNADDFAVIDFGSIAQGAALGFGDPISVPEPTSLAMLAIGGAALMGRRRRQA